MWRRNESAVISNATTSSSSSTQRASRTVRVKRLWCVSLGVNAVKSCAPTSAAAFSASAGEVERPRMPERAARLEGRRHAAPPDPVAVRAGARVEACVERVGCLLGARARRRRGAAAPFSASAARSGGGPVSTSTEATFAERVHARIGAARDGERVDPARRAGRARAGAHPRPSSLRAGAPSRGTPCRRTRSLASGARQGSLTPLVRSAFCSSHLASLSYTLPVSDEHHFLLQRVQPAMVGLIDGSLSTLAPIFSVAIVSHKPLYAFAAGLATSIGAAISMAFSEGLSDTGELTGRGTPADARRDHRRRHVPRRHPAHAAVPVAELPRRDRDRDRRRRLRARRASPGSAGGSSTRAS